MDCGPPGSSVHELLQQEYWSGSSFPSPGGRPNLGIESRSPALQTDSLLFEPLGKPQFSLYLAHGIIILFFTPLNLKLSFFSLVYKKQHLAVHYYCEHRPP